VGKWQISECVNEPFEQLWTALKNGKFTDFQKMNFTWMR
jgi:hypothetical protein